MNSTNFKLQLSLLDDNNDHYSDDYRNLVVNNGDYEIVFRSSLADNISV